MDDMNQEQQTQQHEEQQAEQQQTQGYSPEEVSAMAEELKRLRDHQAKLLSETKTAKQRAAELDEQKRIADEQRLKENEQFKELYEKEQQTKAELEDKFTSFKQRVEQQEIALASSKIGSSLAKDTGRAELLAEKASEFAKHTENGVIYEIGGIQADIDQVKNHLSEKYPFLVDGSGASGGGAIGANNNSGAENGKASQAKAKGDLTGFLQAQFNN